MKGCDKMAASKKYASRDCGVFELTNLATSKKALRVDYANTVTLNITADSVKAKKRGRDAVTFANPMEGTLESEIQVYPFELFSIFGNGTITEGGDRAEMKTITATEAGKLHYQTIQKQELYSFTKKVMLVEHRSKEVQQQKYSQLQQIAISLLVRNTMYLIS